FAEAAIAKRLYQQDRRLARLERDVGISVKTLVLFVCFWRISRRPRFPNRPSRPRERGLGLGMTISSRPWDDGSIKALSCGRRFRRTQTTMLAVIRLHSFSPSLTCTPSIRSANSGQPIANSDHRVGEGMRLLLRQIMSHIDDAVLVQRDEHAGVL